MIISAAEPSFDLAVEELRREFSPRLTVERLGPDVGVLTDSPPSVEDVAEACRRSPLVFIRHLTVELARLSPARAQDIEQVSRLVTSVAAGTVEGGELALQVWKSGAPKVDYSTAELRRRLKADLEAAGFVVAAAGRAQIVSCCLSEGGLLVGHNLGRYSLSDWPGGRARLSRSSAQISRAEFKLEELLQLVDLRLPGAGMALDLGGSPGGWTRILRGLGLGVWVVDPAELDARLAVDPHVRHLRTTSGEFLRSSQPTRFDIAVNDMRMPPLLSCRVMCDTVRVLRRGATIVVTLKLGESAGVGVVRRCLKVLSTRFDVDFARQLHHNRNEATVVAHRQ